MRFLSICKYIILLFVAGLILTGCAGLRPNPRYTSQCREKRSYNLPEKDLQSLQKTDYSLSDSSDALDKAIELWWNTPYVWGGAGIGRGVDCSAYVQAVMQSVYGLNLPRTSGEQYGHGAVVSKKNLTRGDLVFFKEKGVKISHVGIYLGNGQFTHASQKSGVTIDTLDDGYYQNIYAGAKRVVSLSK